MQHASTTSPLDNMSVATDGYLAHCTWLAAFFTAIQTLSSMVGQIQSILGKCAKLNSQIAFQSLQKPRTAAMCLRKLFMERSTLRLACLIQQVHFVGFWVQVGDLGRPPLAIMGPVELQPLVQHACLHILLAQQHLAWWRLLPRLICTALSC